MHSLQALAGSEWRPLSEPCSAFLGAVYAATLVAGLLALRSPQQPIGNSWFSILEILIIGRRPYWRGRLAGAEYEFED